MADSDRPFKGKDPYEDDVSGRPLAAREMASFTVSGRYLSPLWSLLTVIAMFAFIGFIAFVRDHRDQQAEQRVPQTRTVPSTTGSAPAQ